MFVGKFVDQLVKTRGLDYIDKERAKHDAQEQLDNISAGDY
jgi:hypothetical protein